MVGLDSRVQQGFRVLLPAANPGPEPLSCYVSRKANNLNPVSCPLSSNQ